MAIHFLTITRNAMTHFPHYLYKILSYPHWLSTQYRQTVVLDAKDHAFIHLATEDQVDQIISKYWIEAAQVVVLTLVTDCLEGQLVYEASPGKSTKFYHLYQGSIPFRAIKEARVIYQQPCVAKDTGPLCIETLGSPVLRQKNKMLSKADVLSSNIQNLILEMQASMRSVCGIGLAAPQVGKALQLLVIEDMDHSHLTAEQIKERQRQKVPFHVLINPKVINQSAETALFFEGCLSIPGILAIVPRAKSVQVEALNEIGEPVSIEAQGWYARILQHEIDHLHGRLFIDRALVQTIMTEENYMKRWRTASVQEVIDGLSV